MRWQPGPDPDFPYLGESDRYQFPPPETWTDDIVAIGGNLSPGMLLSAYEQGIFPWYNPEDPILWQSPNPRCVIYPETLHISNTMQKVFKRGDFEIAFDRDFVGTIRGCAETFRPGQGGTWITEDIIAAYTEMFRLGWAHSAEAWGTVESTPSRGVEPTMEHVPAQKNSNTPTNGSPPLGGRERRGVPDTAHDKVLVGGCYGVQMGRAFFGESMFSRKANASKAAFLSLAQVLFANGTSFVDCQVPTDHLHSMGGQTIPREEFLSILKKAISRR